jgi:uncharacterized cupredoxin-like copper-binding protein
MKALLAIGASLTLLLAGCGGGDEENGEEAAGAEGEKIVLTGRDFEFDPSTVTIDSAGTYTFELKNEGGTIHALEIEGNGAEEETPEIGPGEEAEVTIDLSAGEYEFYCPVDGHRAQGMEGTITVSGG